MAAIKFEKNSNNYKFPNLSAQLTTDWSQVEIIDLYNEGSGLGFGIAGGRSTGVIVKTIVSGGPADVVSCNLFWCQREF